MHQPFLSIEWEAGGKKSVLHFGQRPDGIITARLADEPFIYRVGSLAEKPLFNAIPPDSLRWRDTKLINVSIFAVLRIIVSEDKQALTLCTIPMTPPGRLISQGGMSRHNSTRRARTNCLKSLQGSKPLTGTATVAERWKRWKVPR